MVCRGVVAFTAGTIAAGTVEGSRGGVARVRRLGVTFPSAARVSTTAIGTATVGAAKGEACGDVAPVSRGGTCRRVSTLATVPTTRPWSSEANLATGRCGGTVGRSAVAAVRATGTGGPVGGYRQA